MQCLFHCPPFRNDFESQAAGALVLTSLHAANKPYAEKFRDPEKFVQARHEATRELLLQKSAELGVSMMNGPPSYLPMPKFGACKESSNEGVAIT